MTADHGRRALPWYDRRQPALLAAAARRSGMSSTPRVGENFEVMDDQHRVILVARFTRRGMLVRAWGLSVNGKRVDWQTSGFGTPRETLDKVTAWIAAGRPDQPGPAGPPRSLLAAADTINQATAEDRPEHLAVVLPFRPRSRT